MTYETENSPRSIQRENPATCVTGLSFGGEGETRTLAPVTRPTPLAGAPRHQLEYFSMVALMLIYEIEDCFLLAERVGFEPTVPVRVRRFSRPFRYDRFGISPMP